LIGIFLLHRVISRRNNRSCEESSSRNRCTRVQPYFNRSFVLRCSRGQPTSAESTNYPMGVLFARKI